MVLGEFVEVEVVGRIVGAAEVTVTVTVFCPSAADGVPVVVGTCEDRGELLAVI